MWRKISLVVSPEPSTQQPYEVTQFSQSFRIVRVRKEEFLSSPVSTLFIIVKISVPKSSLRGFPASKCFRCHLFFCSQSDTFFFFKLKKKLAFLHFGEIFSFFLLSFLPVSETEALGNCAILQMTNRLSSSYGELRTHTHTHTSRFVCRVMLLLWTKGVEHFCWLSFPPEAVNPEIRKGSFFSPCSTWGCWSGETLFLSASRTLVGLIQLWKC